MPKKIVWPETIELPDNWDRMKDKHCLAAMDDEDCSPGTDADELSGDSCCVSMFLGKRLGLKDWKDWTSDAALQRLIRLGFEPVEARRLVDLNNGGTKQAIRVALESKGYKVPA